MLRDDIQPIMEALAGPGNKEFIELCTEEVVEICMRHLNERAIPYAKELAYATLQEALDNTVQAD